MNRHEFEVAYANRHMGYDPRRINEKIASVKRLRNDDGYTDSHMDLCWKIQMIQDVADRGLRIAFLSKLRW